MTSFRVRGRLFRRLARKDVDVRKTDLSKHEFDFTEIRDIFDLEA